MKYLIFPFIALSFSSISNASIPSATVFPKNLHHNEGISIHFLNKSNQASSTVVFCSHSDDVTKQALAKNSEMGGIFLSQGSRAIVKNDKTYVYDDGTTAPTDLMQIDCN